MAANLKGNLGLKSSPLAPTSSKLTTQYLVLDHMTNHYNKIAKAKSAIDSKPPKSLRSSQKMRDRRNRERIITTPSPRQRPVSSMSYGNVDEYQRILDDEPEDDEERLVRSIMRSTLLDKPKGSHNATYGSASHMESQDPDTHVSQQLHHTAGDTMRGSPYYNTYGRPSSARSVRSGHSFISTGSRAPLPSHDQTKVTYNGDVLEKRPHLFTEPERPFTPRTLKNNHESRLKSSRCYNPPPTKSASKQRSVSDDGHENKRPKPQPRSRKQQEDVSPVRDYSNQDLGDTMETSQLSESMLMDITLQSRDGRHGRGENRQVPPLAISMDKDHMNWLQEQASKAEVRARNSDRLRSSLHSEDELRPVNGTVKQPGLGESIKMETMKKDEEQKYLNFAKEVTDDVLSRGICTDSVLQRVFENHIERRKHELDESRMRSVIRDLRKDLGLSDRTYEVKPVASLSDSNYSNNVGKVTVVVNGSSHSGSVQQHSGSSKSTSGKDTTLSYPQVNGDTTASLEPLHVMTSQSEMSTTLDSTSTMKFGQTGDMFSTINSEATLEAEEAEREQLNEHSGLTVTQALKQYQFNLTVKEASGEVSTSARESEVGNSNGEKGSSEHSPNFERPATGERRDADEDETRSDTSSVKGKDPYSAESSNRMRRRERFRKTREAENSSSANNSLPSSEHGFPKHTSDELYSSDKSALELSPAPRRPSAALEGADVADDGDVSVKSSSSSQRPAVKPRTRVRKGSQQSVQDGSESHHSIPSSRKGSQQGIEETRPAVQERKGSQHSVYSRKSSHHSVLDGEQHQAVPSRKGSHHSVTEEERGKERQLSAREGKQDHSSSSAPMDSGVGSGHAATGHDDTMDDVDKHGDEQNSHSQSKLSPGSPHTAEEVDEYEDDYEDDYNADEDEGQGGSTHRTSDDDF